MTPLPKSFLTRPITHRALHDVNEGRAENSPAAIAAAIAGGYGIEIDVQLSSDDQAMVFHDYHLERLAHGKGAIRQHSSVALGQTTLIGGQDTVPTLPQVLDQIDGQVPLLIEIKDQDGAMGVDVGPLEQAVVECLKNYHGDVAVMSFNPHAVAAVAKALPGIPRGLVTDPYLAEDWPLVPEKRRNELAQISDFDRLGSSFISHNHRYLTDPTVARIKAQGHAVSCWTVRSPEEEVQARKIADTITFEGYLAL